MAQSTQTVLLRGGLNLVTPLIAVPAGQCTAALNYEPEVAGYKRIGGYERFDGQTAPSDGGTRGSITTVPGTGAVRGVTVYNGEVYAFRDTEAGAGAMYKATSSGWEQQSFGYIIFYNTGTAAFVEGEVLSGGTSAATADIERVVIRSGTFGGGDAEGYLILSNLVGDFEAETVTSSSGSATTAAGQSAIAINPGGRYDFYSHNFYGAAKPTRMYFANGVGTAFEWDGDVLAPIYTGNANGPLDEITYLTADNGDFLLTDSGDYLITDGEFDKPTHVAQWSNHLFLSFPAGAIIYSGVGEPLDYRAIAGAGEFSFNGSVTGFLPAASTAFMIFGEDRIEYLTGADEDNFVVSPLSDVSGAVEWTAQMAGDQPTFLDDGGLRSLGTTSAFGNFRMGTLTQAVEPLFRTKKDAGATAVASLAIPSKDQYKLFFDDNSGITVYLGRQSPETIPFLMPFQVSCSCSGIVTTGQGERHFVGAEDGYVYEINKGASFDGAEVQSYIRLPWNNVGAPTQNKRFHKATFEVDAPDAVSIGVAFHVDYSIGVNPGGARQDITVAQGSQSLIPLADYDTITWSTAVQGMLEAYLDGFGRNCAVTVVSEHTEEEPHTLSAMTMNFSPRSLVR